MPANNEINVGAYSVYLGDDCLSIVGKFISEKNYSKIFILVDENSLKNCLPQLIASAACLKEAELIEIESGEENKNIEICTGIWTTLTELGADRKSLLVNLGGGVITDMGGFVASTFKRGIDFINIPTTLLAQVDASVGGKTGIDHNNFKNEIGTFCDPKAVFVHPGFLKTLPKRHILSGFAEIIKHALIADGKYWQKINEFDFSSGEWLDLIHSSIEIKKQIIQLDPKESGPRKALNFGHTIGHAIETYFLENGKNILHGEAVALGMIAETYISNKITGLTEQELKEIIGLIFKIYKGLKLDIFDDHRIIELIKHDKKNTDSNLNFTLLSKIGKAEINQTCSIELIKSSLKFYREEVNILN